MNRLVSLALLAASLTAPACVPAAPPTICDVRPNELVIFPADGTHAPTDAIVRILTGGRADDLHVALAPVGQGGDEEPGSEIIFPTTFGDVLEFTPSFELQPDTSYRLDVVERLGDVVATTRFTTGAFGESGAAGADGEVSIDPITGEERGCCSGSGCRDGSVVQLPPLSGDNFTPQLLLISVEEVYNDACGATSRPVATVPVVWRGPSPTGIIAESDLALDGCYQLTVTTQTLREIQPGGIICTDGQPFVPLPPTSDCHPSDAGCACSTGGGTPTPGSALLVIGVLVALWRRRRALT